MIGAGAAGLAAARSLAVRSLRVTLVEARDRVGGRVRWVPSNRAAVPAELGAEFIHGSAEQTMAWLRDAGSGAIDTGGESWTCGEDGDLRLDETDFMSGMSILAQAHALGGDESVERFLRRFEHDQSMRAAVAAARTFVEGFEAADPAIASVRSIADEVRAGTDYASARPLGSYRPLFERLRDACVAAGAQIVLSTSVARISWRPGAVVVEARGPHGTLQTIRARAALVTLPVGVLKHHGDDTAVMFEPSLPASKREALANVEMGHVVRVVLWFRTAFWEHVSEGRYREAGFFRCPTQPFAAYWTQLPVRSEMIVAWAGGPKATALSGASHEELIQRALTGFGDLLGEPELARDQFEAGITHDWSRDPFARGAYSYVRVGGRSARAELAAAVDETLFFAGEAMADDGQGGTVNGALQSGELAAAEIATALGAAG